jgi:ATP-binding cassette subfamily F protein 3
MIHLSNISKHYGNKILYREGSLQIRPGDRIGLVGPNGAGKTTIFRIITGEDRVSEGTVVVGERTTIGYFSQDVGEMHGRSALQEVMQGAGRVSELFAQMTKLERELEQAGETPISDEAMATLLEAYGEAQGEFEQRGGYDLESRAQAILTGLGIGPDEYSRPTESFSGGWKMRIALAKILALNPDVLLMDEPTNHLDLESIVWLEEWLVNFKGAIVMTSHDRDFMNRLVTRVVEIANQAITTYTGNYDFYEREREVRKKQLLASHQKQQDMLAKEEEFIARFAARASHAAQVQSRVKKLEKIDRIEIPPEEQTVEFEFPKPPRGGDEVVKFVSMGKTWHANDGHEKSVFQGASGLVKRLDKVAVVGINGAGKSTLLKLIAGQTEPSSGNLVLGAGVQMGYFSQSALDVLDPDKTVYDEVHDRIPDANMGYVRNLLGSFLFSGDDVLKKIAVLSGGEKSRVVLATILARPVNLLILDEPTNHLDIRTREVLLKALQDFAGTVVIVSHDRHFLKAMATRVFEVDQHQMHVFDGNYEYYLWKKSQI